MSTPKHTVSEVAASLMQHGMPAPVADWLAHLDRRIWELEQSAGRQPEDAATILRAEAAALTEGT